MVSPGVIVTAAHLLHQGNNASQPVQQTFEVIRAPDVGQPLEPAALVAEDSARDLGLVRVTAPRSKRCVRLISTAVRRATPVGSLGFPLPDVQFPQGGKMFLLTERFQGANVSAYYPQSTGTGPAVRTYETDSLMYPGSSGCPLFTDTADVCALHSRSAMQPAPQGAAGSSTRLAISLWVSSEEIIDFAKANGFVI
jgi:hypothetical protein